VGGDRLPAPVAADEGVQEADADGVPRALHLVDAGDQADRGGERAGGETARVR